MDFRQIAEDVVREQFGGHGPRGGGGGGGGGHPGHWMGRPHPAARAALQNRRGGGWRDNYRAGWGFGPILVTVPVDKDDDLDEEIDRVLSEDSYGEEGEVDNGGEGAFRFASFGEDSSLFASDDGDEFGRRGGGGRHPVRRAKQKVKQKAKRKAKKKLSSRGRGGGGGGGGGYPPSGFRSFSEDELEEEYFDEEGEDEGGEYEEAEEEEYAGDRGNDSFGYASPGRSGSSADPLFPQRVGFGQDSTDFMVPSQEPPSVFVSALQTGLGFGLGFLGVAYGFQVLSSALRR